MKLLYSLKNICLNYTCFDGSAKYREITALKDFTLDIYENEYLVVLGANGSGKSSLGKLLAGIADSFTGELYYYGEKIVEYSRDIFQDTALVLQEPQFQLLMPTVREELALPLRNRGVGDEEIKLKIEEIGERFGLKESFNNKPDDLSGGQTTSLAIATALITEPLTIILDEPDSHLDSTIHKTLDDIINQYHHHKTIISISQYPLSARKADRVIILNNCRLVAQGTPSEILENTELLNKNNLKISREKKFLSIQKEKTGCIPRGNEIDNNDVLIVFDNVCFAYDKGEDVLNNIDLKLYRGQKVGLVGPSGSGKTTLGLIMTGFLRPNRGEVRLDGKDTNRHSDRGNRNRITMAMQFPERAMFEETIADDIAFGPKNLGKSNIHRIVDEQLSNFKITAIKRRHPFSISGGEKRKAALAGIMAMGTEIIILDEPSAALDPTSTYELIELINSYRDKTIVTISHDLDFIAATCNRIVGMKDGNIICNLSTADFFANKSIIKELGLV